MAKIKRQKFHFQWFIFFIFTAFLLPIQAQNLSPVGYWQTVSDRTGNPSGVVQITEKNGVLYGKIVAIFEQGGNKPTDRCVNCKGDLYNKPILGMTVMWGLRDSGEGQWSGGKILDPKIGKIYNCKLKVYGEGKYMRVRGYIGFSLLGRTQIWMRTQPRK